MKEDSKLGASTKDLREDGGELAQHRNELFMIFSIYFSTYIAKRRDCCKINKFIYLYVYVSFCVFNLFVMQCNVFKDLSALLPVSCRNKMFLATSGDPQKRSITNIVKILFSYLVGLYLTYVNKLNVNHKKTSGSAVCLFLSLLKPARGEKK